MKPHLLLIEDNEDDATIIRDHLMTVNAEADSFAMECADRLDQGLARLNKGGIDALLLDLNLPDSRGIETFLKAQAQAPQVPIVILSGLDDKRVALEAVQRGAQDYLVKSELQGHVLPRVVRYAIERHRLHEEIHRLASVDDLTGLYNRRTFLTLAEQQIKQAERAKRDLLLLFIDLDGLKGINDTFGHRAGDLALKQTAIVLRQVFRKPDILARIGGDEFVVLAVEAQNEASDILLARLDKHLRELNAQPGRQFSISFSLGVKLLAPFMGSMETFLDEADKALYDQKRARQMTGSTSGDILRA